MSTAPLLMSGIPRIAAYRELLEAPLFRAMESFSDEFLRRYAFVQDHYSWVKDPLHQWSRQWEYPFVYQAITSAIQPGSRVRVLDAGSGITFFPYYLANTVKGSSITCCDSDASLQSLFEQVTEPAVRFIAADLHSLPFADGEFDVVYCVSVLEHTRSYARILDEFRRVLRPGGSLILTFDIGLDGVSDIALEPMRVLLGEVEKRFRCQGERAEVDIDHAEILTSRYARSLDAQLLPWRFPRLALLKAMLRAKRLPISLNKNLTVYCSIFVKPAVRK